MEHVEDGLDFAAIFETLKILVSSNAAADNSTKKPRISEECRKFIVVYDQMSSMFQAGSFNQLHTNFSCMNELNSSLSLFEKTLTTMNQILSSIQFSLWEISNILAVNRTSDSFASAKLKSVLALIKVDYSRWEQFLLAGEQNHYENIGCVKNIVDDKTFNISETITCKAIVKQEIMALMDKIQALKNFDNQMTKIYDEFELFNSSLSSLIFYVPITSWQHLQQYCLNMINGTYASGINMSWVDSTEYFAKVCILVTD